MYINFKEKTGNYICAVNARESAGYLNGVWAVTRLINGKPHSRLSIHLGGFVEFHFDFLNEDGSVKTLNALETSMKNGTREYYDNNSEKEFETPKTEFIIDKNCLFFNDFASMIVCFNGLMFRSAEGRKRILRVSALRNKERIMKAVSFNFSYEGKNNIIVDRVMVPILAEPQKASCPITKNEMMGICAQKKIMYSLKNMYQLAVNIKQGDISLADYMPKEQTSTQISHGYTNSTSEINLTEESLQENHFTRITSPKGSTRQPAEPEKGM